MPGYETPVLPQPVARRATWGQKQSASNRLLQSGSQFVIRKRTWMIHRHLPGTIQDDQSRRRTRPVSIEILIAQRHRHVLQTAVVSCADGFDIRPLLFRRGLGSLRRLAVGLGWSGDEQALRRRL